MDFQSGFIEAKKRMDDAIETSSPELDLQGLSLRELPLEKIAELTDLYSLNLCNNGLNEFPIEICQLKNLRSLNLSGNVLSYLPREFGQLVNLHIVDLNNNRLTELPNEICQLSNLEWLMLNNNHLIKLPEDIGKLTNLRDLDISGNNLRELPEELGKLHNLRILDIKNNPKLLIPPEISSGENPGAILDFWYSQCSQTRRPLNEAKLILVGQGGVGKTSLVKMLIETQHDPDEKPTRGISISHWPLQVKRDGNEIDIKLNIWDFGGQEIMHATHQFFMTRRSLYILVLDARQGEQEGRVEYWLALIRSFAGDSPILIVINKTDLHFLELNRRGLMEKYPAIVEFVHTSAQTGLGKDKLTGAIRDILAELDHIDTPFPESWYIVKKELEELQKNENYLPYNRYRDLCLVQGIKHEASQQNLIGFLHDLGVLLNFQEDDRVRDTNILRPEWVTKGVYSLINADELAQKGGILERTQLHELLDTREYPIEVHGFILRMMEKFELAYALEKGDCYLIPDLLPVEQPEFEWEVKGNLNFEYRYAVLPYSILHRFIVRQNTLVDKNKAWRTGVMLNYEKMQALIKADIEDKKLSISIRGEGNRRSFLSNLRFVYREIHKSIMGIQPEERVPIPDNPGVTISYEHLRKLEEIGHLEYLPERMSEPVNIRALLDGIEDPESIHGLNRSQLRKLIMQLFDEEGLRILFFDLELQYEELGRVRFSEAVLYLISKMEQEGRIQELTKRINRLKPQVFNNQFDWNK